MLEPKARCLATRGAEPAALGARKRIYCWNLEFGFPAATRWEPKGHAERHAARNVVRATRSAYFVGFGVLSGHRYQLIPTPALPIYSQGEERNMMDTHG